MYTESDSGSTGATLIPAAETMTVQVALDSAAFGYDRLYTYLVPAALRLKVQDGMRILVPFGHGNRRRIAMVVHHDDIDAETLTQHRLKPVAALIDSEPVLTEELLELVKWLYDHTFCTWFDAVRAVLPGGMQLRIEDHYRLLPPDENTDFTEQEQSLYDALQGAADERAFLALMQDERAAVKTAITGLMQKGCLLPIPSLRQAVGDSSTRMIRLSDGYLQDEKGYLPTSKQTKVAALLREHGVLSVKECAYLAGVTEAVLKNMIKGGIAEMFQAEQLRVPRDAVATINPADTILSPQQQAAFDAAAKPILERRAAPFLLYGVTGSGKTAVFEQLIALTLQQGRQVLLLIPEISLTPQVVQYFQSRFGNRVALIHSGLSLGQRLDTDKLIRRGEISIVIGTRSAVFAPLPDIGLIILDEEGEHSYKSEQSPRYHAVEVARVRAKYHHAVLLLASATPSLESRYLAERKVYQLLRMPQRYNQAPLPKVEIIDMNEERMAGNLSPFSTALKEALQENIERGEQSILLLNRRGYHTMLQCTSCYEPVYCPNCSVPMTFHKVNDSLLCHYCGHAQSVVETCPKCGNNRFRKMGFGTQKMEEELQGLFPDARILRMDADTTMSRTSYEKGFQGFAAGEYDILCGTQMIGKGLDFPNVTLVGVVSVDKALFAGDYRSYERTFSLITQVVGRGGRGKRQGRAILQTHMPQQYVLQLAAKQDYDRFYQEEIALRRALTYPPICDICVIGFSGISEQLVRDASMRFSELLRQLVEETNFHMPLRVLGPADASYARLGGKFRRRTLLKCKNTADMRNFIRDLLDRCYHDKAFAQVSVYADMNGDSGV